MTNHPSEVAFHTNHSSLMLSLTDHVVARASTCDQRAHRAGVNNTKRQRVIKMSIIFLHIDSRNSIVCITKELYRHQSMCSKCCAVRIPSPVTSPLLVLCERLPSHSLSLSLARLLQNNPPLPTVNAHRETSILHPRTFPNHNKAYEYISHTTA